MVIKEGDSVRVKPGVKDPDYEFDLNGRQGRVTYIDTDEIEYIEVAWDSVTLNQMSAELIETSIEGGFDYSLMWLNENEVVLTEPRDQQQAVDEKIEARNERFGQISSDEQSKNIAQILDSKDLSVTQKNQDKFYIYLSEQINYPYILTGTEDFSWEEPYVSGVFDRAEYEILKKNR